MSREIDWEQVKMNLPRLTDEALASLRTEIEAVWTLRTDTAKARAWIAKIKKIVEEAQYLVIAPRHDYEERSVNWGSNKLASEILKELEKLE
jgi:hypothetical protein